VGNDLDQSLGSSVLKIDCTSKSTSTRFDVKRIFDCSFLDLNSCNSNILGFCCLRWGWVFLEWTRILSGIQFTTHFIDFFVVETKRFVDSSVNVVLTRQTCGQRSRRTAESKRQVIENYLSERICYLFLISKCRGDWDLGMCTFWVLAKRKPLHNAKFRFFCGQNTFFSEVAIAQRFSLRKYPKSVHT